MAEYIRDNVQVVCMDVSSTDNAYVIFEALNDRGVDLSVLDLVKNYVFTLLSGYFSRESGNVMRNNMIQPLVSGTI